MNYLHFNLEFPSQLSQMAERTRQVPESFRRDLNVILPGKTQAKKFPNITVKQTIPKQPAQNFGKGEPAEGMLYLRGQTFIS